MSLNRLELKSTSAFRLRALRPWQQTRIHCQEQPETKSGEVISPVRRSPGNRFATAPHTRSPDTVRLRQVRAAGQCSAGDAQLATRCSSCTRCSYCCASPSAPIIERSDHALTRTVEDLLLLDGHGLDRLRRLHENCD